MKYVKELAANVWILFIAVIILASIFRLPLMQYTEFKSDEALNLFLASRPLFHHPFPPASQASSAGILNFPLINYLLYPIVIFTLYPPTISFVIAVLNVITIGGFFLLFAKYHGKRIAFLAAAALSLSPWAILYSRKIWAQDFLLPLSLPFFFSLYKILGKEKKYWLLFGASSMLLLQIHQVAIFLPIITFVFLLLKGHKPGWKFLIGGIILGLLPTTAYFFYQAQSYCISCQNNTTFFARFSFHSLITFIRPLQIMSIGNFHTQLGDDFALLATQYRLFYLFSKISYFAYALIPIGAYLFWKKEKHYGFFTGIFITALLLFFLLGIEPLMHYYILLMPFLALFISYCFTFLLRSSRFQTLGIILVSIFFIGLFVFNYGVYSLLAKKGGFSGEYGSGFVSTEQNVKQQLLPYGNYINYKELVLASYVSPTWLKGYMPVGAMLYPHKDLEKQMGDLEEQFEEDPKNPITTIEITAYYTKSRVPTWQYVLQMKKKADRKDIYKPLYKSILNDYLSHYYKNLYETPQLILLYPQHWKKVVENNNAELSDDKIILTIRSDNKQIQQQTTGSGDTSQITVNGKNITQYSCNAKQHWCGTFYGPVIFGGQYYLFSLKPIIDVQFNSRVRTSSEKIATEILDSITDLSE